MADRAPSNRRRVRLAGPAWILIGVLTGLMTPDATARNFGPPPYTAGSTDRFLLVDELGGEAVLDRDTNLVWERVPSSVPSRWVEAMAHCARKAIGGRGGWRLPSFLELMTLVHPVTLPSSGTPALPPGHPFRGIRASSYWTGTQEQAQASHAYVVDFARGDLTSQKKVLFSPHWCVQDGASAAPSPIRPRSHSPQL